MGYEYPIILCCLLCCLLCFNGQGIVRAAKPLFVAVVALCGTAVTNNGAIAEP